MKPRDKKTMNTDTPFDDIDDIVEGADTAQLALDSFHMHAALGIYTMNPHSPKTEDN